MKQKIILLTLSLFLILIGLNFINALDNPQDLTYQVNQLVELKIPCINNGTYCSSLTTCNITIVYQDGSTVVQEGVMDNQGSYFNYTVNNNSRLGIYRCNMNCIDNGLGGVATFNYNLTSTGDQSNWSFWLILAIFSLVLIVIAIYSGNEYLMFMGSGATIITGMYSMIYGVMGIFNFYTQAIALVIIGLGLFFMIISSLKAIAETSGESDAIGGWGSGGEDYDYFKE